MKSTIEPLMSVEQLMQISRSKNGIEEDEHSSISFSDALQQFYLELNRCKGNIQCAALTMKKQYFAKHSPPIKFVGQGVGRTVFACNGGKCLKVARDDDGTDQNKADMKHFAMKNVNCFTKLFNADKKYGLMIEVEACAKLTAAVAKNIFNKDFGISSSNNCQAVLDMIVQVLWFIAIDRQIDTKHLDYYFHLKSGTTSKFYEALLKDDTVQKHIFYDIAKVLAKKYKTDSQYYRDDDMPILDLHIGNFGLVVRDKQLCIVILDAGLM